MSRVSPRIHQTYEFLRHKDKDGASFSLDELRAASGYADSAFRANLSKKWRGLVCRNNDGSYRAVGFDRVTLDAFARMCSQSSERSRDPLRPDLPPAVEGRVLKSRDAALAAVQHYNNPTTAFRTDTYIVLMVIAYTSLFHALCERDRIDYRVFDRSGAPKQTSAGEPLLWDLKACTKHYQGLVSPATQKNLEFCIGLRDKVEHRFVPQIDTLVAGHCHSLLLNFERLMVSQFTPYHALGSGLAVALQLTANRPDEMIAARRAAQAEQFEEVMRFVTQFHKSLADDLMADPQFALRVWLIPKPANEARRSHLALEYVDPSTLDSDDLASFQSAVVAIRVKQKPVYVTPTDDWLWETELVDRLRERLGKTLTDQSGTYRLTNARVRDILRAADVSSHAELCSRAQKPGARACYHPNLVDMIVEALNQDPEVFYKAHCGQAVDLITPSSAGSSPASTA